MANCIHFPAKRFHTAGPQKTLFIPGPLLHVGLNEIVVFDSYGGEQVWSDLENLGEKSHPGCPVHRQTKSWGSSGVEARAVNGKRGKR